MFLSTPRADPSPGVDEWHRRARTAAQRLYGTPPTALPAPLCLVSRLSTGLAGQARSDRLDEYRGPEGEYGYGGARDGTGAPSPLLEPTGGVTASSGGRIGYRGALGGAGAAGLSTGQTGGHSFSQRGGVGYIGAWGGDGVFGASGGQMDMLTSSPMAEFSYAGALGGAGVPAPSTDKRAGPP